MTIMDISAISYQCPKSCEKVNYAKIFLSQITPYLANAITFLPQGTFVF